jgi:hypothetical protein
MSIKRECIEAGFVVTFRQYGEFLGHEFFLTRSEMLEQLDDYREAGFTSLEVVGIRHRGRYLSPRAVAVVLDQETWDPPSALGNPGRPSAKHLEKGKPEIGIRAVRTKQVACEVLPLRIFGLTHFLPL